MNKGGFAPAACEKQLGVVKRWVEGLEDDGLITAPRNMQRYIRSGSEQRSKPQFFTVEEVHTLYRSADPTMRACIALALNTGYTQIDIASLTRDHIGEDGIINPGAKQDGSTAMSQAMAGDAGRPRNGQSVESPAEQ